MLESPDRIEPCMPSQVPEDLLDLIVEITAHVAVLGSGIHPITASTMRQLVRRMNCYYTNLIVGHRTLPREIDAAMEGRWSTDPGIHDLQQEAASHIRVQALVDERFEADALPEPASPDFLAWVHAEDYRDAAPGRLVLGGTDRTLLARPGMMYV